MADAVEKADREAFYEKILKRGKQIHFIGVGGVGMISLFAFCRNFGFKVSGSDIKETPALRKLISDGERITIGHNRELVKNADIVVYTTAVGENDPELSEAKERGIPTLSRAEFLGILMKEYKTRIGVSGSHGKSTVTAMISHILSCSGKKPTTLCGAELEKNGAPYIFGEKEYLVYESCEYKDAFLNFCPTIGVFTNLEHDHIDYFPDLESIKLSFIKALNKPQISVINADDENLGSLLPYVFVKKVLVGEGERCDFKVTDIKCEKGKYSFKISHGGRETPKIQLKIIGKFSVFNASLAFALSSILGLVDREIIKGIESFSGIPRRTEYLGEISGKRIFYDYAHHPTEISETLRAVSESYGGGVSVIFKPHTFSRTEGFFSGFVKALSLSDRVYMLEIDPIREEKTSDISSEQLAKAIGEKAAVIKDSELLTSILKTPDLNVIIMGAGHIDLTEIKRTLSCEGKSSC